MSGTPPGLFITGTDTGVGKTYVAGLIARALCEQSRRVGVYKPVATGCHAQQGRLVSDDAVALWQAAGQPAELARVCPQCFRAPLAPPLAASAEGRAVDRDLLRRGLDYWAERSDVLIVEGVGGLLTPLAEEDYVADLAAQVGFPLIIVTRNVLGTINQTLQTLHVAGTYGGGLKVAGVVLNDADPAIAATDMSVASNSQELRRRCRVPLLAHVPWKASAFSTAVDWASLASCGR